MATTHLSIKVNSPEEVVDYPAMIEAAKAPGHSGVVKVNDIYIKVEHDSIKDVWTQRVLSADEVAQLNQ
jgi:hypothetical protein